MIFARTIFIVAIAAQHTEDPHIIFVILLAGHSKKVLCTDKLDINGIVLWLWVLIQYWQRLDACFAANGVFSVKYAMR